MFAGADRLPVKIGDPDASGYREPNWDRGISSRTNYIAAMITPFVRPAIKGNIPAFLFDKSVAGTGGGYQANGISCIVNGERMATQEISPRSEEFSKALAAELRTGAPLVFFDNIASKINSGPFASVLTTGRFKARKLGSTEMLELDVVSQFMMTGNNTKASDEILRRVVPTQIDAACERPGDRDQKENFKHHPDAFFPASRPTLVRSIHVLVRWWIQQGSPAVDADCYDRLR